MDELVVSAVTEAFRDVAFANGVDMGALHVIMSEVVRRLREANMSDDDIMDALDADPSNDQS